MSFLTLGKAKDRYGILIDIGSGSVLAAIVHSNHNHEHPIIVWAHREHVQLKKIDSIEQSAKAVMSALMSTCIKLDGEGRKALSAYKPSAKLSLTQVSIAAPWSYTVTKTVNFKHEDPFVVTKHFLDELVETAQKQVEDELGQKLNSIDIGLTVIARSTMDLLSNGYRIDHPIGERAKEINLTQATVVAQSYVNNGVTEVQQKLFPGASIQSLSFVLMLYCTIRSLHPHTDDVCLVDITDEASEIGIIRDGSLKYSTHTPFGMFSLAREISEVANVPLHEAFGYLRAPSINAVKTKVPDNKHSEITLIFDAYIQKLTELLNETGDSLSIPKEILLHIEASSTELFTELLLRASKAATNVNHIVTSIADEIMPKEHYNDQKEQIGDYINDTALLLSAEFFHKQTHCLDFRYS
jgi:cell division ATPase FtsA